MNNIIRDESNENGEDPALKSLSLVFKSLFNNSSSSAVSAAPSTSAASALANQPNDLMAFIQTITQSLANATPVNDANSQFLLQSMMPSHLMPKVDDSNANGSSELTPYRLLKMMEPLINENLVKEIQTVYEFHLRIKKNLNEEEKIEIFHLDLKNSAKGQLGLGPCMFSKADCIIKLSDEDLSDLLTDKLKPFTAYMSGRIEIEGDLQDVFKLKKLIKTVTSVFMSKKPFG